MELATETLALLFFVAVLAGVLDAIAGGGGLITLPVLVIAGLSPLEAVATNKIQALSSVLSSASRYARAGVLSWRALRGMFAVALAGAGAGAIAVQFTDTDVLEYLVPVVLIAVAVFFLAAPVIMPAHRKALLSERAFMFLLVPAISFYDGFFGPGTGSLYAAAFVAFLARDLVRATAETKALNSAGSLLAAGIFVWGGAIVWPAALAMAAGAVIGGQIGAHVALRFGAPVIRLVLVAVAIALALRLLLSA